MLARLLPAIALWLVLGAAPVAAATPFFVTDVDTLRRTGLYTSLALDRDGEPWIAYYDATVGDLKVARRSLGRWTVETVDPRGFTGAYPALAFDTSGTPYVAYMAELIGELRFAWREPGGWRRETVDSRSHARAYTSLHIGADGVPRFVYYDFTQQRLLLTERGSGAWTHTVVDQGFHHGLYPSLALADDGTAYVAYLDGQFSDLRLAVRFHGVWSTETIDSVGAVGPHTGVGLDRQGSVRVSYFDVTSRTLRLARKEGAMWQFEVADTLLPDAASGTLVLDDRDQAWIAYSGGGGTGLRLAHQSGGAWVQETVDLETGTFPSIALDAEMNPRISYYDTSGGDLRFADAALHLLSPLGGVRWAAGSSQSVAWEGRGRARLELSDDAGTTYVPVAEADAGAPIEFVVPEWTSERGRLRLARDDPPSRRASPGLFEIAPDLVSPWWTETVDAEGFPGRFASLAVTANGPAVAYRAAADGGLRVAFRGDRGWSIARVGAPSPGTGRVSLAAGDDGTWSVASAEGPLSEIVYREESSAGSRVEPLGESAAGALDLEHGSSGAPAIAFYDALGDLRYAEREASGWRLEHVAAAREASDALDLDLGTPAGPAIIFYDAFQGRVRLAQRSGSSWSVTTLPRTSLLPSRLALRFDPAGHPRVASSSAHDGTVLLFEWDGAFWSEETVAGPGFAGEALGFALDAEGEPWLAYGEVSSGRAWIARRQRGVWSAEPVDGGGRVGPSLSLALDGNGRARIAYFDVARAELRYVSSAVELDGFDAGASWPAGAEREVRWRGTGRVALAWTDTAGALVEDLGHATGGSLRVRAPATAEPLVLRLERAVPSSRHLSRSPVRFGVGVVLAAWSLEAIPDGGVRLTWSTRPALPDLAGYRLERRAPASDWSLLAEGLADTSYLDPSGSLGDRYRLTALDGTGAAHDLGERAYLPEARLSVWPSPWREGPLVLGLRVAAGATQGQLSIHAVDGRRVRLLWRGPLTPGEYLFEWDGRDEAGRETAAGVYYARWSLGAERETRSFVRLR